MNYKKLIAGGLAGGFLNFLGGWLFYGLLFAEAFDSDSKEMNMLLITLGCFSFGFFVSYVFLKWAHISTIIGGLNGGLMLGFFTGIWSNFFMWANESEVSYNLFALDVAVSVMLGGLTGLGAAWAIGRMKD